VKRNGKLRTLSAVLGEVSKAKGWERRFSPYRIFAAWAEVVGREQAEVTRPFEIRGATLVVAVPDNVWLNQLSFMRQELLSKVNAAVDGEGFADIRLVVNPEPFAPQPLVPEPVDESPGQPDKKNLQRLEDLLSSIEDVKVREVVRKVWLKINQGS